MGDTAPNGGPTFPGSMNPTSMWDMPKKSISMLPTTFERKLTSSERVTHNC